MRLDSPSLMASRRCHESLTLPLVLIKLCASFAARGSPLVQSALDRCVARAVQARARQAASTRYGAAFDPGTHMIRAEWRLRR